MKTELDIILNNSTVAQLIMKTIGATMDTMSTTSRREENHRNHGGLHRDNEDENNQDQ